MPQSKCVNFLRSRFHCVPKRNENETSQSDDTWERITYKERESNKGYKWNNIHRKLDNMILLFASDIFKWSLLLLVLFFSSHFYVCSLASFFSLAFRIWRLCLGRWINSSHDIICTSPNLMCDDDNDNDDVDINDAQSISFSV